MYNIALFGTLVNTCERLFHLKIKHATLHTDFSNSLCYYCWNVVENISI